MAITVSVHCKACGMLLRVSRTEPDTVSPSPFEYCMVCGERHLSVTQDHDLDYWEALSEFIGYPVEITKALIETWDPRKHQRFGDFVKEMAGGDADS